MKGNPLTLLVGMQTSTCSLWRTVWRFLKKLQIELPYDPAIPLLDIHSEETRIEKDTCTPMFVAAFFFFNFRNCGLFLVPEFPFYTFLCWYFKYFHSLWITFFSTSLSLIIIAILKSLYPNFCVTSNQDWSQLMDFSMENWVHFLDL